MWKLALSCPCDYSTNCFYVNTIDFCVRFLSLCTNTFYVIAIVSMTYCIACAFSHKTQYLIFVFFFFQFGRIILSFFFSHSVNFITYMEEDTLGLSIYKWWKASFSATLLIYWFGECTACFSRTISHVNWVLLHMTTCYWSLGRVVGRHLMVRILSLNNIPKIDCWVQRFRRWCS